MLRALPAQSRFLGRLSFGPACFVVAFALLVTLTSAVFVPPLAADKPEVTSSLEAWRVILDAHGKEQFVEAGEAAPGDVLEYRLSYHNGTAAVLQRFVMQGPIPLQTEFIDGSAVAPRADGLEVLVDDLGWQTPPVKRRLIDANGATIDQIVPPTEYRALRWPIAGDLLSNQTITASYRVRVNR